MGAPARIINLIMIKLKTVEECDAYIDRLSQMTPDERKQYKEETGIRDFFGLDAIEEIINVVKHERKFLALTEADKAFFREYDDDTATEEQRELFLSIGHRLDAD